VRPAHVLGNSVLGDVDTKFQQLTMNARCAPERRIMADRADQIADLGRDPADRHCVATSSASRDGSRFDASVPASRA
jgi:hypothetical protein